MTSPAVDELTDEEFEALYHDTPWYSEHAPLIVKDKETTEDVPWRWNVAQRFVWAYAWRMSASGRLVRIVIPKARQLGVTTLGLGHKVHVGQTRADREMLVLLHDLKLALPMWKRMEKMAKGITNLPQSKIVKSNDGRVLGFDTGSNIYVESVGKQGVGRGNTVHHVHATELPSWDDPETVMDGVEDAVPELPDFESSIILESTSEGVGDWWYRTVKDASRGKGMYGMCFLPWWIEPQYGWFDPRPYDLDERKLKWFGLRAWSRTCGVPLASVVKEPLTESEVAIAKRIESEAPTYGITYLTDDLLVGKMLWRRRKMASKQNAEKFKQEFPLTVEESFLGTGRPVFDAVSVQFHINRLRDSGELYVTEPSQRLEIVHTDTTDAGKKLWTPRVRDDGPLSVWKGYEPPKHREHFYLVGGDPSSAVKDPSAIQVLKILGEMIEQVAVFHGMFGMIDLAYITAWLAQAYGNAGIIPEAGGENTSYVDHLAELRWPGRRLYRRQIIAPNGGGLMNRWGFDMNMATRPAVFETMDNLLRTPHPVFRHRGTLEEIEEFRIDKNGRPDHPSGGHSDLLMAWGITAHNRNQFAAPRHKPTTKRGMGYETSKERRVRTRLYADGQ